MRILITGGAGFIGSHITDQYIAAGHEVAIADNMWAEGGGKAGNLNPHAQFYHVDVTNDTELAQIFNEVKPEIVNHHAAQHSVGISTKDPQFDARVNVFGLLNVLTNCARINVRKIIFAASAASYGTPAQVPLDEESIQRPASPYGITKMVAEHYLRYWQEAHGLNYTALRYGNVYGPRQDANGEAGVISIFAKRFLSHEGVRIDWDGKQCRDFVYVSDVAQANLLALTHGDNNIFCIGTGRPISVNEIHQTLTRITGFEAPITRAPKRPGDIYTSYFKHSKAEHILGWKPEVAFEDGLRATIKFLKEQA